MLVETQKPTTPTVPPETHTEDPATQLPASPSSVSTTPEQTPRSRPVITIPTARMNEIKKQEREKGKQATLQALNVTAKELGYSSHEDMITKLKQKKGQTQSSANGARSTPASPPLEEEATPAPAAGDRRTTRRDRELARAHEQRKAAHRARAAAERREKATLRQAEAREAEHELSLAAVRHGVRDTEYALLLLKRRLAKLGPKELEAFDEDQFFKEDLRKSHPYVYGEEVQPATTSPTSSREAVKPGAPPTPPANGAPKKDAREMTQAEFNKTLRDRGYNLPHLGTPS